MTRTMLAGFAAAAFVAALVASATTALATEITDLDTRTQDASGDSRWVSGIKSPNTPAEGTDARRVYVRAPNRSHFLASPGETTLLPFVLRAPDQTEAGSCLYMSLTGAAEIWLAKLSPQLPRTADGPLDLSERWLMNTAGDGTYNQGIQRWRVDSVYLFNNMKEMATNAAYRFTKGWYEVDSKGHYVRSSSTTAGAKYETLFNWFDDRGLAGAERVKLPVFSREILFEDPAHDSWNVGVAPNTLVEEIKTALRKTKAPVQVIYNHFGYWHANLVVGYDDDKSTDGCGFVEGSRRFFNGERMKDSPTPPTQAELDRMAERKKLYVATAKKINASIASRPPCNPKGIFYVRDSIYVDEAQPDYAYDPSAGAAGLGKYSIPIVELEYSFVTHLANHALVIKAK
ncbi:MAG: hypothetical protein AAB250_02545 [Bdellovibrionota bacterium]